MAVLVLDMPRFFRRGSGMAVTLPLHTSSGAVQSVAAASLSVWVDGVQVAAPAVTISAGVASATVGAGVTAELDLGTSVLLRWLADGEVYDVVYAVAVAALTCPITDATLTAYLPQFEGVSRVSAAIAAAWREVVGSVASPWWVIELVGAEAAVKHLAAALLLEGAGVDYTQQAIQQRELAMHALGRVSAVRATDDNRAQAEAPVLSMVRRASRYQVPRC